MEKVYPGRRLMLAEAANTWCHSRYYEIAQHGGRWRPDGKGGMNMNVGSSDGSVQDIMDWTNRDRWEWSDMYYYPSNGRAGDTLVTRYPGDPGYPWFMSDAPFAFWTSFDRELYDGALHPWGEDYWPPVWW